MVSFLLKTECCSKLLRCRSVWVLFYLTVQFERTLALGALMLVLLHALAVIFVFLKKFQLVRQIPLRFRILLLIILQPRLTKVFLLLHSVKFVR